VCWGLLQCVAVCVAGCCRVLQYVAVHDAVCCSVLQCLEPHGAGSANGTAVCWSMLECAWSVLKRVAVCCSVLQCVAVLGTSRRWQCQSRCKQSHDSFDRYTAPRVCGRRNTQDALFRAAADVNTSYIISGVLARLVGLAPDPIPPPPPPLNSN